MIPVFARTNGLVPVEIPRTGQLDADVDRMRATRARITYLCSPNNPTGGALSREAVEKIVEGAAGLVIIDQAYVEFGGESFIDILSSRRPVLITRTMSKAFGLAGLRVGYVLGSAGLVWEERGVGKEWRRRVTDGARDEVRRAAGGEADDDFDGLRRPVGGVVG